MNNTKLKYCLYLGLTIAWMAFIFLQSAFPADLSSQESGVIVDFLVRWLSADPDGTVFAVRKTAHFLEYLVLGFFTAQTLWYRMKKRSAEPTGDAPANRKDGLGILPAWLLGTLYAMTDELHQLTVPGRSGEARDVFIDSLGVLAGAALVLLINRKKNQHMRH